MNKTSNRKTRKLKKKKRRKFAARLILLFIIICTAVFLAIRSCDYIGSRQSSKQMLQKPTDYIQEGYRESNGIFSYNDDNYKSNLGIDVSEHQGTIDWNQVKGDDIKFAFIRLGYSGWHSGKIVKDKQFDKNINGAKKAGIDIGIYFFSQASTKEEGIKEAEYVISEIKGKGVTYPVVFDMEPIDGTERTSSLSKEEKTEIADAFCKVIKKYGFTPAIYGNPTWLSKSVNMDKLSNYDTWLAYYTTLNDYKFTHRFWQFTQHGRVSGIGNNVDLNLEYVKKTWYE